MPGPDIIEEVRWGDQQMLTLVALTDGVTNQLVKMSRQHPETWTLNLFAKHITGFDVAGHFRLTVNFEVIYGAGSANVDMAFETNPALLAAIGDGGITLILDNTLGAVAEDYLVLKTPYNVAFKTIELPAKDIQVRASVISGTAVDMSLQIGAFIAPRYYPLAPSQLPTAAPQPTTEEHWMGPGWDTDPLRYHRG
jgi:hypothetical protein